MLDIGMVDFLNPGILSRLRLIYTDCFFFVHAASRAFGPPALMPWAPSTPGRLGYNEGKPLKVLYINTNIFMCRKKRQNIIFWLLAKLCW